MIERLVLLGKDHPLFGIVSAAGTNDGRAGLATSAGGDPTTSKWETKGDPAVPNEDAACLVDAGARVLLAVADSHFGHRASHAAVEALAAAEVPADAERLEAVVAALERLAALGDESETTLAIAVLDRGTGTGFGICFGDSTVASVAADGVEIWSTPGDDFVTPGRAGGLVGGGRRFRLMLPPGAFLVLHTDGVDGCGGPNAASIGPLELRRLRGRAGPEAARFARLLAELALQGVGGHPGGHDNVTVAAAGR